MTGFAACERQAAKIFDALNQAIGIVYIVPLLNLFLGALAGFNFKKIIPRRVHACLKRRNANWIITQFSVLLWDLFQSPMVDSQLLVRKMNWNTHLTACLLPALQRTTGNIAGSFYELQSRPHTSRLSQMNCKQPIEEMRVVGYTRVRAAMSKKLRKHICMPSSVLRIQVESFAEQMRLRKPLAGLMQMRKQVLDRIKIGQHQGKKKPGSICMSALIEMRFGVASYIGKDYIDLREDGWRHSLEVFEYITVTENAIIHLRTLSHPLSKRISAWLTDGGSACGGSCEILRPRASGREVCSA